MTDHESVTALVTGFEPFDGATVNASWEAVRSLPERLDLAGGTLRVDRDLLPVSFTGATARVRHLAWDLDPDIIIHVGLDAGARQLALETRAVNEATASIPDNDGNQPQGVPLDPHGPGHLAATWPAAALAGRLGAVGHAARVSDDAGRYVCNATLYTSLLTSRTNEDDTPDRGPCGARHGARAGAPRQVGFLHVPTSQTLPTGQVAAALRLVLTELADLVRRRRAWRAGRDRLSVPRPRRRLRVGLTGGIGSGKSTVARQLAARGAVVIDADQIAREVLAPGTEGLEEVAAAFGPEVLTSHGDLDRAALAQRVFNDSQERLRLEAITHPRIAQEAALRMDRVPAGKVALYDVPLLAEAAMADLFDMVVVVEAFPELRLERLAGRGVPREQALARMAGQASDAKRRAVADRVLTNNGSRDDLEGQVEDLARDLARAARQ